MRIAIPVWNGRVSPVFDEARKVRVVDIDLSGGRTISDATRTLRIGRSATTLSTLGVELLICSAISAPLEAILRVAGVKLIPNVCGKVDDILRAFVSGDTELSDFRAPGNFWRQRCRSNPASARPRKSEVPR